MTHCLQKWSKTPLSTVTVLQIEDANLTQTAECLRSHRNESCILIATSPIKELKQFVSYF